MVLQELLLIGCSGVVIYWSSTSCYLLIVQELVFITHPGVGIYWSSVSWYLLIFQELVFIGHQSKFNLVNLDGRCGPKTWPQFK